MRRLCRRARTALLLCALLPALAAAQEASPAPPEPPVEPQETLATGGPRRFRLGGEMRAHFRHSRAQQRVIRFPFPSAFQRPGQTFALRTASPGASLEVSTLSLVGEGDLTPHVTTRLAVHFLDLYDRDPTSSDDLVALREAWVRFGRRYEPMEPAPGTTVYGLVGKAPRFTKQAVRRLDSYGLWGTAVGRLEELQLELGGTVGRNVYWRAQLASGNPLFMRDPNALAGDNGVPGQLPSTTPFPAAPSVQTGFPILYDGKATDLNLDDRFQLGGGLGLRARDGKDAWAVDVLAWVFHRDLADSAPVRGSFYPGELALLKGLVTSLPVRGRAKTERGLNLEGRFRELRLYGQYVDQEIAGLERDGFEVEVAYRIALDGLFVSGDQPVLNWVMPAVRFSKIDDEFPGPAGFLATSVAWDWTRLDLGVRVGIVRGVDLTVEYARHSATPAAPPKIQPHEWLVTLRTGF